MCIILKQPHINWLREPDRLPEEETMVEPLDEQILLKQELTEQLNLEMSILHNIFYEISKKQSF